MLALVGRNGTALPAADAAAQMPYSPYGGTWGVPPFYAGAPAPWAMPYAPSMTREEELNLLRDQAQAIKDQLDQIETRMRELESKES